MATVFAVFVVALSSSSCKHDKGGGGEPKPKVEKVTLTFEKGVHVKKVEPNSIEVEKGKAIKLSELKKKINVECDAEYEADKFFYGAGKNIEIKEDDAFKPNANTNVYITAKKKGSTPEPQPGNVVLASVKVGGNQVAVIDEMDAGSKTEAEVDVEFTTSPEDAKISFAPKLKEYDETKKSGIWALNMGVNSLKITVTKENKTKEYTLKITREKSAPKITSITLGPHTKDGDGIILEEDGIIEIPVPIETNGTEYEVKVTTDTEGVAIEYDGLETNNKVKFEKIEHLTDLEKEFTIKISKDGKENTYKVKAMMMVHSIGLFAGRYMGKNSSSNLETVKKIMRHENVDMTMYGDKAIIIFASQYYEWKTVLIDNVDSKTEPPTGFNFRGYGKKNLALELGKSKEVEIILSNSDWENGKPKEPWLATEKFKLTITCPPEKADAFIKSVRVNADNITDETKDEDAFTALFEAKPPEIECSSPVKIAVELSKPVQKVAIGDQEILENQLISFKDAYGYNAWKAEVSNISLINGSPKEIVMVVTPKEEDVNYRETTMKVKLVYKGPPSIYPSAYDINGVDYYKLPSLFKDGLYEKKNPEYYVDVNMLNMKFVFFNEPKKVIMDIEGTQQKIAEGEEQIKKITSTYGVVTWEVYMSGIIDTTEKQVVITFEPKDTDSFSNGEYRFKITGTANKPKLNPVFEEISKDKSLPKKAFLNKLTDHSKPIYKVKGDSADIVISLSKYEYDFLLKEVKLDNVATTLNLTNVFLNFKYKLEKTIDGLTASGKEVKIEFIGKENVADDITWEFKLATGGTGPVIPMHQIKLGVNEYGENANPFTSEFMDDLENKDNPLLETYGKKINVRVRTFIREYLKSVKFKIDDKQEVEVQGSTSSEWFGYGANHTFEDVEVNVEHKIVVTLESDDPKFASLVLEFKVKSIDELPSPKYTFGIDEVKKSHGYKAKLDKDFAKLFVQTLEEGVIDKVEIGKEGSEEEVEITSFKNSDYKVVYQGLKLIDIDAKATYVIKITPKNLSTYAVVTCKYYLEGTKIDENNASFILTNKGEPDAKVEVNFKNGINGKYREDYGAISAQVTAYTMTKVSTVKAIRIDTVEGEKVEGDTELLLTRTPNTREVKGLLNAYDDKPTRYKVWVIGNNNSIDNKNGVYKFDLNPVPLFWSYQKVNSVSGLDVAYSEIKISKTKVKNNKVYVFVAPWKERYGYKVSKDSVADGQPAFENVGSLGTYQDVFRVALDVSSMNVNDSKEIVCKILQNSDEKEALIYKIKVVMKD